MHHFSGIPPPRLATPPPPPGYASRVSTTSDNLFTSARASLKQAPIPKEAPINPPARPKGLGVVPPDKMAAFLNEMKTVRLRKTSSDLYGSRSAGSDTSSSSITLPFTRSTDQEDNVRTGEKRKRFDSGRIGFRGEPGKSNSPTHHVIDSILFFKTGSQNAGRSVLSNQKSL